MNSKRPRGSWGGAAAWHSQVIVIAPAASTHPAPGDHVEVDEDLAPILLTLWQLGFPTWASCQNAPLVDVDTTESGEAHIHFLTVDSADRFAEIIGDAITYRPTDSGTSVAFATGRLREITTLLETYRFAVAVHEAGHGVVGATVGFQVPAIRLESKGGGQTSGGEFAGDGRFSSDTIQRLSWWFAGDAAVEEICGGYRLPVDTRPNSDVEKLRREVRVLSATESDQRQAQALAKKVVRSQRVHIITIAEALLAAKDGRLAGKELETLLTPVWKAR
jgi:hypothetical protein